LGVEVPEVDPDYLEYLEWLYERTRRVGTDSLVEEAESVDSTPYVDAYTPESIPYINAAFAHLRIKVKNPPVAVKDRDWFSHG
jgi:hypothetical protein